MNSAHAAISLRRLSSASPPAMGALHLVTTLRKIAQASADN
ncbi:MAG: hypothetical protein K0R27_3247 [Xanthobacteraceae bacterium]|jgi:hypothetical protein|nr:hypothetical protein [Xanthobacteraceae bacterium]